MHSNSTPFIPSSPLQNSHYLNKSLNSTMQQQQDYQLQHQHQHQYPSVNPLIMDTDGKWREAQSHVAPPCPRCASANTKFCYYNNYSLAQPRYFCKACRRYWTKGGSLRNVPVGGGCRKSRCSRSRAHRHRPVDSVAPDNSSSSSSSGKSGGPEIDMAAVFARYVSQDVGIVPSQEQGHDLLTPALDDGQAFKDLESFDYEMLVTDDVFWSTTSEDGSTANWEPMAPLEELDSAPLVFDEQFMGSPDLVNDLLVDDANYWSCFDLAGCGDFYRP